MVQGLGKPYIEKTVKFMPIKVNSSINVNSKLNDAKKNGRTVEGFSTMGIK